MSVWTVDIFTEFPDHKHNTALRRKLPQEEIGNMGSPAIMSELLKRFMQRILILIDLLVSCSSSKYEK